MIEARERGAKIIHAVDPSGKWLAATDVNSGDDVGSGLFHSALDRERKLGGMGLPRENEQILRDSGSELLTALGRPAHS